MLIFLQFLVSGADGRASELPALERTANLTQFDFVLDNFTPSFSKSRFALETVLVSLSKNKNMSIDETQSIDDEYSPGVFTVSLYDVFYLFITRIFSGDEAHNMW